MIKGIILSIIIIGAFVFGVFTGMDLSKNAVMASCNSFNRVILSGVEYSCSADNSDALVAQMDRASAF